MENIKVFRLSKTIPGDVVLLIHPYSNMDQVKVITLSDRNPHQTLPLDWAVGGVFMDDENYRLYKKGLITFDHNEELVKAAYEMGAYFDDSLDFVPAATNNTETIFNILKAGNHAAIMDAIEKYGENTVKMVAISKSRELATGVVKMLESKFKVQLLMDGE